MNNPPEDFYQDRNDDSPADEVKDLSDVTAEIANGRFCAGQALINSRLHAGQALVKL